MPTKPAETDNPPAERSVGVAIVEDDQDIRDGLALLIDGSEGCSCVGAYASCEAALEQLPDTAASVMLMDVALPGISGVEGARKVRELRPDIDVMMLTIAEDDRTVFDSLCAGACGYLLKTTPPARIIAAIHEVAAGGAPMSPAIARMVAESFQPLRPSPLTPRESEVLAMLCRGKSYKAIAAALYISQGTVHTHLKNIYRKLEVSSKSEAIVKAFHDRLL